MTKKKIIIISIVLIGVIALFVFRTGGFTNPEDEMVPVNSSLGNDFISILLGVENITLDTSLLNSQVFQSLSSSGAYVNPNPSRGKADPFSASNATLNNSPLVTESLRDVNLGQGSGVLNPNIIISRITTTTATITITPVASNVSISAIIVDPNGAIINIPPLTYKTNIGEHNTVVTGLKPNTLYSVQIQSPNDYAGLQAQFETR